MGRREGDRGRGKEREGDTRKKGGRYREREGGRIQGRRGVGRI